MTSTPLIAELPELSDLNRQQISALVGVATFNSESGTMRGKQMIYGGRKSILGTCTPSYQRGLLRSHSCKSAPDGASIARSWRKPLESFAPKGVVEPHRGNVLILVVTLLFTWPAIAPC
ncbi:hypothetical protein [Rhodopirellula islandica]|uniref:hypothetical protein n=1 Tax=Rhodopirellula islandica TaxID=595434 RepID=UPI001F3A1BC0|nr:hypothetical protein [Rhodopirellula islandica]